MFWCLLYERAPYEVFMAMAVCVTNPNPNPKP